MKTLFSILAISFLAIGAQASSLTFSDANAAKIFQLMPNSTTLDSLDGNSIPSSTTIKEEGPIQCTFKSAVPQQKASTSCTIYADFLKVETDEKTVTSSYIEGTAAQQIFEWMPQSAITVNLAGHSSSPSLTKKEEGNIECVAKGATTNPPLQAVWFCYFK